MSTTEPQTTYQRHHQQCKAFNERLLGILYRDLAERQADFDADRHDLQLRRYHAAQVFLVQKQIEDVIRRQEELEPPMPATPRIIDASPPQKTRARSRRRQPGRAPSFYSNL